MAQQDTIGKHRTTIAMDGNNLVVTYQNTQVVKVLEHGSNDQTVILDSGTWRTSTTKTRMNQTANEFGLGFYVHQRDYEWFVKVNNTILPFSDGMQFSVPSSEY